MSIFSYKKLCLVVALFSVVVSIVLLCVLFCQPSDDEQPQGKVVVGHHTLTSSFAGRVLQYMVEDGDFVGKGDTVAVIDAFGMRNELISDLLSDSSGITREQVSSAYQVLQRTKQCMEIAERSYQRMKNLYDDGVVSTEAHDDALVNYKAMEAQVKAAQYNYETLCVMLKRSKGIVFDPGVDMRGMAKVMLNEKYLVSNVEGEIDGIHIELGEMFSAGAKIASVNVIQDVWGVFELDVSKFGSIKVGTRFSAYVPAFSKEIEMVVEMISDVNPMTAENHDKGKVVEVKARPVKTIEGLRPGMQLIIRDELSQR